jgi:hypothetical protein
MGRMALLIGLVLASFVPAWAQRRLPFSPKGSAKSNAGMGAMSREQDRQRQLLQAKRNFSKAELEAISAASSEVASAKAAHHTAIKEYKSTRESVEKSVEASLGIKNVREEVTAAQKAYREAADPVLHALKGTPEYQAAEKKAEAAKSGLLALKDDSSLGEAEKKSRQQELAGQSLATSTLERAALQKDPRVRAAREKLDATQKKLADLQKKADEKVDKDSTVTAAQEAVKNAHASIQTAEANLAAVEGKAAVGEQMLQAGVIPKTANQNAKGNNQGKGGKKN